MRPSIEEAGRDEEFANIPVYMVDYGGKEACISAFADHVVYMRIFRTLQAR